MFVKEIMWKKMLSSGFLKNLLIAGIQHFLIHKESIVPPGNEYDRQQITSFQRRSYFLQERFLVWKERKRTLLDTYCLLTVSCIFFFLGLLAAHDWSTGSVKVLFPFHGVFMTPNRLTYQSSCPFLSAHRPVLGREMNLADTKKQEKTLGKPIESTGITAGNVLFVVCKLIAGPISLIS